MNLEEFSFVLNRCRLQPHDRFTVTAADYFPDRVASRELLIRKIVTMTAERGIPVTCRATRAGINVKVKP